MRARARLLVGAPAGLSRAAHLVVDGAEACGKHGAGGAGARLGDVQVHEAVRVGDGAYLGGGVEVLLVIHRRHVALLEHLQSTYKAASRQLENRNGNMRPAWQWIWRASFDLSTHG